MNEATLIQAALIVPVGAAIFALLVEEGPVGRAIPIVLMIAAAACAAAAGVFAAFDHPIVWQRFEADAWRALLAAGSLAATAAAMAPAAIATRTALAIGGGAAAGSIFAPDVLYLGVLLLVSSTAFTVAALADPKASPLRRMRWAAPLLAADALAIAGLSVAAGTTLAFEPLAGSAGALVLAAAAIKLGLVPAIANDAMRSGAGAIWLGPVRAQGALLAAVAVAGSPVRGFWLLAIGAIGAGIASVRLLHGPDAAALLAVPAAIAAAGIGLGGPVATAGAAATLATAFAAIVLLQPSGEPVLASPVLAFAPAGGALVGFGLAGGALWRLASARAEFVPAAVAIGVAAGLAAVTSWQTAERTRRARGGRGRQRASGVAFVAIPGIVVAAALAFAPALAADRAAAAALAAGAAPALLAAPESFSEGMGIAVAALTLAGLVAGGVARGTDAPRRDEPAPRWMHGWAAAMPAPRERSERATERAGRMARPWTAAAAVAGVAAAAFAARLVVIAGGRGWL